MNILLFAFASLFLTTHSMASCQMPSMDSSLQSEIESLIHAAGTEEPFKLTALEQQFLDEVNLARTKPKEYAAFLRERLTKFKPDNTFEEDGNLYSSNEGKTAVIEAITFLESQAPLAPLKLSKGLTLAGRDHVLDLGPFGTTGHYSSDGKDPFQRAQKYGSWSGSFAENISYTPQSARGHVINLIVDDGVASRGHRKNIFDAKQKMAGASCGPHSVYNTMCVMDFAGKYTEKSKSPNGAIQISEF